MNDLNSGDIGLKGFLDFVLYQISFRVCFYARYFAQWWRNHWA
jgi:hypothetical protein